MVTLPPALSDETITELVNASWARYERYKEELALYYVGELHWNQLSDAPSNEVRPMYEVLDDMDCCRDGEPCYPYGQGFELRELSDNDLIDEQNFFDLLKNRLNEKVDMSRNLMLL